MESRIHELQSPSEREARERLLQAETALKDQREQVAALRRALPPGPLVPEDYEFQEVAQSSSGRSIGSIGKIRLSQLFPAKSDNLVVIHAMFGAEDEHACPMCTMWADGYDAIAPHVVNRTGFVLVAKQPAEGMSRWAGERGWRHLRLLSSHGSTFNADFGMEQGSQQLPGISVFRRAEDGIHHFYSTQFTMSKNALDPEIREFRGIDLFSPVWHVFDLLPEGRESWMPALSYSGDPGNPGAPES
jgi:predicted dithiol-disulfide oxidoreductase (DUF899 family)